MPRSPSQVAASADGVLVSYESHGQGPPLVLVHGWSCDRTYWDGQAPLAGEYQLVTIDLAGHGHSGQGRSGWTIAAFGDDVAAVVEALSLERAILVGHSMGGDVIVEAARRLEGMVAGLVWVDVYKRLGAPRTPEQVRTQMAPFRADFIPATHYFVRDMFPPGADPLLVDRVAADMAAAPRAIALEAMESAMTCEAAITAGLQELRLPAVAINPDDRPTDLESMARYGIEVVLMPGVGHFPMMEDPERFNALLRQVAAKLLA